MLTIDQLRRIMPALSVTRATALFPPLVAAMDEFAINLPPRMAAFLAQIAHESVQLQFLEEIWGPTAAQIRYEPPSDLATKLGNTEPGDGKRFKGRGPVQITGRANYKTFGDLLGIDLIANPERAAQPDVAFRIAGAFWRAKGLNALADLATAEAFVAITKAINGGINGLTSRQQFYAVACGVFGVAATAPLSRGGAPDRLAPGADLARGAEAVRDLGPNTITFVVPGQDVAPARGAITEALPPPLPAGFTRGTVKHSVHVATARGDAAVTNAVAVVGEDVVVIEIAGGPELVLHPEHARELLAAQSGTPRSGADPDTVAVPPRLQWQGLDATAQGAARGGLGEIVVNAVHVVTGLFTDAPADLVADAILKRFDARVDEGVYRLVPSALTSLKGTQAVAAIPSGAGGKTKLLVFIHGTFSDTAGTFSKLWSQHANLVIRLFGGDAFGSNVYALDHCTLRASPIHNALTLAKALPENAEVYLVTHSRGGLVAEVLAHACAEPDASLDLFGDPAYADQRAELAELMRVVAAKRISVKRIVRVACPARGTLLASGRLDAYVSIVKWTLQLAGVPIAPELVDFLGAVAKRRTDPTEAPGLAAQMPDSPLVQWLHRVADRIPGDLYVVAGELEGDSVASWVKTLVADAFYWTDNDLVVQTRSMYGGAPRVDGGYFQLNTGGSVSHFTYFANELTATAVVDALVADTPPNYRQIGPLSWAGESSTGARAASAPSAPNPALPALFVLPGILGSNLKVGDQRVWLGWRLVNGFDRLAYPGVGVAPDGPIEHVYEDLIAFFAATHEVIPFAFDWRIPIEDEAGRLAKAIRMAIDARKTTKTPVRIVAHSMGGLIARALQFVAADVWNDMLAHDEARVLMLGTPNGGSWAPMQVLSGDDTFGNIIVDVGAPFHGHDARAIMGTLPGLLQLQAGLLDPTLGLGSTTAWQKLADDDLAAVQRHSWWHNLLLQLKTVEWGIPTQAALDASVALRQKFDAQRDRTLLPFMPKLLLVVGHSRFTPAGFSETSDGLVYLNTPDDGDGRVTVQGALLPGIAAWKLDCDHGSLPSRREAFAAYQDLLSAGTTKQLEPLRLDGVGRGAVATLQSELIPSRPSRAAVIATPPEGAGDAMSADVRQAPPTPSPASRGTALRVVVANGDLTFVHEPLMIGHYRSLRLTGAEWQLDRRVGEMQRALDVGLYPDAPGSNAVFVNSQAHPDDPRQLPRPEAVIVVGLGPEGDLQPEDLVETVERGVLAWAHHAVDVHADLPPFFELAATLIASGGSGVSAGQAAQLIAEGVAAANERLRDDTPRAAPDEQRDDSAMRAPRRPWPQVSQLRIIELYLERATEALGALQMQAESTPGRFAVDGTIAQLPGALRRSLDAGYRGADYDFISALTRDERGGMTTIEYTLDTKRARSEVRAQRTQTKLIANLLAGASSDLVRDERIGPALFDLLVPMGLDAYLSGTTELQLQLDGGTAAIPWELLDTRATRGGKTVPWAIRTKLLRKLRTSEFRSRVDDSGIDAGALVIGEPKADPPTTYPRLPGARKEARTVAGYLSSKDALGAACVRALIASDDPNQWGPDQRQVILALNERPWRIVHISGHGEPPLYAPDTLPDDGRTPRLLEARGVVLSGGTFLSTTELKALRRIPELVFVNCCHLAAMPSAEMLNRNYAKFAAGVAEELIRAGVRCVIAAGWAVDDAAASEFATTFYKALLEQRCRFIDAVARARQAAWVLGGNTWAAYQCYGDPDWRFRTASGVSQATRSGVDPTRISSSAGLVIELHTIAVRAEIATTAEREGYRRSVRQLADTFSATWGNLGDVAEALGLASVAVGDDDAAIAWLRKAIAADDGRASIRAATELGNMLVRRPAATANDVREGLAVLDRVAALEPSAERESLRGSAYKRLALLGLDAQSGNDAVRDALREMRKCYLTAEVLACDGKPDQRFYPAMNRMAATIALRALNEKSAGEPLADLPAVRQSLAQKARDDPDFWSVSAQNELDMYEAIVDGRLAAEVASLLRQFDDLHSRVSAQRKWRSVYDTARLVLPLYQQATADPAEQTAAQRVLQQLATWAAYERRAGTAANDPMNS